MAKGTILLVEDNDQLRHVLARMLADEGYEVLEAFCGREALSVADRRVPDVLVIDRSMPGMNGDEVLKFLSLGRALEDRVIVCTGRPDAALAARYTLLEKPVDYDVLARAVADKLRAPRTQDQLVAELAEVLGCPATSDGVLDEARRLVRDVTRQ